jgi:hypothetical protein
MICIWKISIYAMFRIHWNPIKGDRGWNFPQSFSRYSNKINNMSLNTYQQGTEAGSFEDCHHSCWAANPDDMPEMPKQKI